MSLFGFDTRKSPYGGGLTLKRDPEGHESWVDTVMPGDARTGQLPVEISRRPLLWLAAAGLLFLTIIGLRLFDLQIINGARNFGLAEGNRIRQRVIRPTRGVIYDRNHAVLARNQASFDVTVVPQQLPKDEHDRQAVYQRLSGLIGVPTSDIQKAAEAKGLDVIQPILVVPGLDRGKALILDQSSDYLPGFALDVNPIREYMDGGNLSQILGYTGRVTQEELDQHLEYLPTDYTGKLGIEKQYDSVLRGSNGSEQTEVDATGKPIRTLATKPPQPGANLVLSIDKDLEDHLAAAVQKQMQAAGAKRAAGVAINPKTGEVLASVSLPTYDGNLFSRGISQGDYSRLSSDPGQPLFNKVMSGAYPSGSTIKPLVASAALDEHVITPETTITDEGKLEVPNVYNPSITYTFFGWEHTGLGVMNVYRAIAMSSDIYFYTIAGGFKNFVGLGIERLDAYYRRFGIGQKTGVDLPDETAGRLPTPDWKQKVLKEPWYTGDTYNIAVGQGDVLVSPLQLAVAIAAVANGGTIYKPHIGKAITDDDGNIIQAIKPEAVRKSIISAQSLSIVRDAMRQTVASGTACCFFDKQVPVPVAGKTGTAETNPGANEKPDAWFTAFAPYNDPQIVMVVLVEHSGEGAEYAVPAVRETLAWCFTRPGGCVR